MDDFISMADAMEKRRADHAASELSTTRIDSVCGESYRKATLEMTAEDHRSIGSTPPKVLKDNPDKTLAETMDDAALHGFVRDAVAAIAQMHADAMSGDARTVARFKEVRDGFLLRDVGYLRAIGRLPSEFVGFDPMVAFALPDD